MDSREISLFRGISANSHGGLRCLFYCVKQQISLCGAARVQGREQRAAGSENVTPSLPTALWAAALLAGCYFSGCASLPCCPRAREPRLWRPVSPRLIHVQEWEGQGHRHTPASCCLLFPASPGVAPSPNMTGGWSSQGNHVMGQFSRKAVNSIHKPRPSDGKGTWLRRGSEGLLCCYWCFCCRLFTDISCCSTEIFTSAQCLHSQEKIVAECLRDTASVNPMWAFNVSQAQKMVKESALC